MEANEEALLQKQVEQLENTMKQLFTKEALQRYTNVRLAHPDKAMQLLVVLAQLAQSNKVRQVDDTQLKSLLMKLEQPRKETKISFMR